MPVRSISLVVAFIVLMYGSVAVSSEYRPVEDSSPQAVVEGMSNKFVRGVANVTTGWLELPKQIYETGQEDGVAQGVFVGPLKGVGMTIIRTLAGVGELVTFFFPFPGFYDPYIEPNYVWQKE